MTGDAADALAAFRAFDYERIYLRPASIGQARAVIDMLQALVEHAADRPALLPGPPRSTPAPPTPWPRRSPGSGA